MELHTGRRPTPGGSAAAFNKFGLKRAFAQCVECQLTLAILKTGFHKKIKANLNPNPTRPCQWQGRWRGIPIALSQAQASGWQEARSLI
jgi:hypothetical protein